MSDPLRGLARSLASDLDRVIANGFVVPPEKARLTRRGGRCEVDGVLLEFDPFSPRTHRCPSCGRVFDDDTHYRWWVMGYQLWLAERALHAATLYALERDSRYRDFATAVLDAYAESYLQYPNRDNVLGPTRVFFSTYLESIWLLQLIVALDLLESTPDRPDGSMDRALGARVRERVIEPSATLIRGYDEGASNRQVWNNAALLAASRVVGAELDGDALYGRSGLRAHLATGLLSDGTWYEGENYHLFAHRGLWYGVRIAERAGVDLDRGLIARFDEAFATPFVTALPDFTFPSRRDSQYRVSLRQWRFAELAELGLARNPSDDRLQGALATLYHDAAPRRETDRWRSTAEAERNGPATALDRSALGWRSLLFALPELPRLGAAVQRSALLAGQGLAIIRRDAGRLYAALDYGHSGAGHGHPDRLNCLLVDGDTRWLDDVGTGSYVDPSLHWYRSTLAHNAPLVDGQSQKRIHGSLLAYEDRGGAGWVRAAARDIAPGVLCERTIVVMPNYLIDELTWRANRDVTVDLPLHVDGEVIGVGPWAAAVPRGGSDPEDGFTYLRDAERATGDSDVRLDARCADERGVARVFVDAPHEWWRALSLGPPGQGPRRFHFVRATARRGAIVTVWDLSSAVSHVTRADAVVTVHLADGSWHEHRGDVDGWHIALTAGGSRSSIDLGGVVKIAPRDSEPEQHRNRQVHVIPRFHGAASQRANPAGLLTFELGEMNYRRSEPTWREAGSPTARVSLSVVGDRLTIAIDVSKRDVRFAPRCESNPLDNENPDTNSDGVQLHLAIPSAGGPPGATRPATYAWLIVPEEGSDQVRISERASAEPPPLRASWSRTQEGYRIGCAIPAERLGVESRQPFLLDVIVNDMAPDRERRRGQLVLGGSSNDFVYLRGDRHDVDGHLAFVIADA
ncbi:MAG: Heparinase family protein [Geminicoccaceae bacterium]|nr:Heparinase family protein [Geminicoccaceae bacterium]